jgi:uncharacterized protein YecE (DUF72 family)
MRLDLLFQTECHWLPAARNLLFHSFLHQIAVWAFQSWSLEMAGTIRIGTSGWNYSHWRGRFYDKGLPQDRWLARYAEEFETVEINNTFYQQPDPGSFRDWHDQVPGGFLFSVKAHRFITHMKKLKDPEDPLRRFFKSIAPLKKHLGPLLYQLPPHWKKNVARLDEFAEHLPARKIHVIEFRDADWLAEDVFETLQTHQISLCIHDLLPDHPRRLTGAIAYLRFHGTTGKYHGRYGKRALKRWCGWIREAAAKRDVYVYFNNDTEGHAIEDARTLKELLA